MPPADSPRFPDEAAAALRARLDWDDARLLAECDVHLHRTGGPGGQHRNKVASAVRLVHRPTGFAVTATERRSQHENRANALTRLREAIAVGVRQVPPDPIHWPPSVQLRDRRLRVSPQNVAFWWVLALSLDCVAAAAGDMPAAAERLGVTPSSLVRFLAEHPKAWVETNRLRVAAGRPPLRAT